MAKPLKVLYVSHYFPPEVNAPAVRVSEMAASWAQKGIEVTVLTGFPNHPTGVIPTEYRGLWRCFERHGEISIVRTYVYAAANKGFIKRIINYLSFMLSSILIGSPMVGKPEIVIATSPQFFVGLAGFILSRIKKCKFIFEVRDLWPEEIVAVGALKNKIVIRFLEAIEMFLYRKADHIVAVASGTIENLKRRGVPESKLALIPNGVDIDFLSRGNGNAIRNELGLDQKFVVGYIGTHGMAHKLETVLEAAKLLSPDKSIQFLFVGDGAEKNRLVALADAMDLDNVTFHGQIPRNKIPDFYAACEICLAPLRKADLFTRNIPSKLYEIMAASRPVIISTEGESRSLVEKARAGLGSAPEDPLDLSRKIRLMKGNEELRRKMGNAGYAFVLANSSRSRLADSYLELMTRISRGRTESGRANQNERNSENIIRTVQDAPVR